MCRNASSSSIINDSTTTPLLSTAPTTTTKQQQTTTTTTTTRAAGEDSRTTNTNDRKSYGSPLDYLNAMVAKKTAAAVIDPSDPESRCYLAAKKGEVIYPRRSRLVLYTCWSLIALGFYRSPSLLFTLGALAFTTPIIDLYGGVLHIVLDEPTFMDYPIIGRGCLEFQWHHILPYDLSIRSVSDVTGDLNQIVPLMWILLGTVYQGFPDGRVMTVVAAAIFNAYLGIFSHQMAHKMTTDRPAWVRFMQKHGLLVDPDLHREHHRYYQDGFSILNGMTSPFLTWAFHAISNKHVWLALFVALTAFLFPVVIKAYLALTSCLAMMV